MEFDGALQRAVSAKDVMLFLIGRFGLDGGQYQAVEYRGPAIRRLPMQERMTLCNMTAELGGQTGLIGSDNHESDSSQVKSRPWIATRARLSSRTIASTPRSSRRRLPRPTRLRTRSRSDEFRDVKPTLAYIGACTERSSRPPHGSEDPPGTEIEDAAARRPGKRARPETAARRRHPRGPARSRRRAAAECVRASARATAITSCPKTWSRSRAPRATSRAAWARPRRSLPRLALHRGGPRWPGASATRGSSCNEGLGLRRRHRHRRHRARALHEVRHRRDRQALPGSRSARFRCLRSERRCGCRRAELRPAPRASRRPRRSSTSASRRSSPSPSPVSSTATRSTSACRRWLAADAKRIRNGDRISIDYARNEVFDLTTDEIAFESDPAHLMEMVRDGGLLPHLEKRLKCRTTS